MDISHGNVTPDSVLFNFDAPTSYTLQGTNGIAGAAGLTKQGSGTLTITNINTYSGGTTVAAGTLSFANGSLGSTGNITLSGGTLQWGSGNSQDVSARLVMVNAKTAAFDTNGNNVTLAGAVGSDSSASLAKAGAGTLTLAGAISYTGSTTVGGGAGRSFPTAVLRAPSRSV